MDFSEGLVVEVMQAVVDDGACEDVADVRQCVEDFDQITVCQGLRVFLHFLT